MNTFLKSTTAIAILLAISGCASHSDFSRSTASQSHNSPSAFSATPMAPHQNLTGMDVVPVVMDPQGASVSVSITPLDSHYKVNGQVQKMSVITPRIGSAETVDSSSPQVFALRAYQYQGNNKKRVTGSTRIVHYTIFYNNVIHNSVVQTSGTFTFPLMRRAKAEKNFNTNINGTEYHIDITASVPTISKKPKSMTHTFTPFPDEQ